MAKVNINMLISVLTYIDINYMTDEECNSIYDLDINDESNQKYIIRRLIVPGVKSEYSKEAFDRAKEVILMGINNIEAAAKIFQQMSFPFENDIADKKAFLEIMYQELFKKCDDELEKIVLKNFKSKLEKNLIITKEILEETDIDELLDMRDEVEFYLEWIRVFNNLDKINMELDKKKLIDSIREISFLRAYNMSESRDIASCVSDDFELICKAYVVNYNDIWLNSLISYYANGRFPCGKLNETEYNLEDSIKNLLK